MRTTLLLTSSSLLLWACGDDTPRAHDAAGSATADTTAAEDSATAADSTTAADTTTATVTTTAADSTTVDGADAQGDDYLAHCESFFAARIVELQIAADATFPKDCDAPLTSAVSQLRDGGKPMCHVGESANACRTRRYENPPALDDLDQACWNGHGPAGCMHASYLPRCADGGDACAEDEAVCADGTRPMVFAEAATAGPSDVWWFHLGGEGGPCSGVQCWLNYRFGENEFQRAMSTLHPTGPANAALHGEGIQSGDAAGVFGHINRVKFERCTDAASDAIESAPIADGVPAALAGEFPGQPIATVASYVPVWHRGFDTWLAAFHHMTTLAGRDRDGDGDADLPSLADAKLVVISGSSDASMWVTFAADRLAAEIRAIAGPDVDVRMAIDGMFPPMLDNEGRYHADAPEDFDMLSQPFSETGLCTLPDNDDGLANEGCSDANYAPGGTLRSSYEARGVLRDASCEAMHGADAPECFDRNHTLVHHVGIPVFILADQEDNTVSDGPPVYADDSSYHWDAPATYRRRIVDQAWDLVDHWSTAAREEGAGAVGDLVLALPKTRREGEPWGRATHVRFGSDDEMAKTLTLCSAGGAKVATLSFSAMIGAWLQDGLPQTFAFEDAARPLPNGNVWVTGSSCRAPE